MAHLREKKEFSRGFLVEYPVCGDFWEWFDGPGNVWFKGLILWRDLLGSSTCAGAVPHKQAPCCSLANLLVSRHFSRCTECYGYTHRWTNPHTRRSIDSSIFVYLSHTNVRTYQNWKQQNVISGRIKNRTPGTGFRTVQTIQLNEPSQI